MNNSKSKRLYFIIFCVLFSLFVASVVTIIEHNSKQVKSETKPVPVASSNSDSDSVETETVLPHQVHYISGWDKCLDLLHVDCDVALLGDSITYMNFFDLNFPDLVLCNLGVCSDTIKGVDYRIGTLETIKPEKVVLMIGINSLRNNTLNTCIEDYDTLVEDIKTKGNFDLIIMSVTPKAKSETGEDDPTPENIIALNKAIAQIADKYGATYLDLFSLLEDSGYIKPEYTTDGLHLSEDAYDVWADLMRPYLY